MNARVASQWGGYLFCPKEAKIEPVSDFFPLPGGLSHFGGKKRNVN